MPLQQAVKDANVVPVWPPGHWSVNKRQGEHVNGDTGYQIQLLTTSRNVGVATSYQLVFAMLAYLAKAEHRQSKGCQQHVQCLGLVLAEDVSAVNNIAGFCPQVDS